MSCGQTSYILAIFAVVRKCKDFQMQWMQPTIMCRPPDWCSKQIQTLLHPGRISTLPFPLSGLNWGWPWPSYSPNSLCNWTWKYNLEQEQPVLHCVRESVVRTIHSRGTCVFLFKLVLCCTVRVWIPVVKTIHYSGTVPVPWSTSVYTCTPQCSHTVVEIRSRILNLVQIRKGPEINSQLQNFWTEA